MAHPPARIPWSRFVALGDSLTEGVGDPAGRSLRGWADRLADSLRALNPDLAYWNLGRRGLTTRQVRETQVERALGLEPDLVSIVAGMNDLLAPDFDPPTYRSELRAIAAKMAASGATLLMGTFPKELPILRVLPRGRGRERKERLQVASDVVLEVAAEYGAECMDAAPGWRYTMAECSIDGCHPNARGHAHIAELGFVALCRRAAITAPAMDHGNRSWVSTSFGHLRWLASQGYLRRAPELILRREEA
ncbi:MAG: SGNH/GDSL hydrolase family protein [Actinomycetota bacterium]